MPDSRSAAALAPALACAARVVAAVRNGQSFDDALARALPGTPDARLRAATLDLAYGALRRYGRDARSLRLLLERGHAPAALSALLLVALARLALQPERAHATVDQAVSACELLRLAAMKGLANAVLRNAVRRGATLDAVLDRDEEALWQHPAWWLARLRADHPQQWPAICAAGNSHPPFALRVNRRRIVREAYLAMLADAGIAARAAGDDGVLVDAARPVSALPGFGEGLASVQDLGAQRAAALLNARAGMRVLDACAAPGGKAAHILESAEVDLLALDIDAQRVARIEDNFRRLGLRGRALVADCTRAGDWWDGRGFERILADVPCSGSGVARRHPDIKWLRRDTDIGGFAARQHAMLAALWPLLAPGGQLLYATCSVFAAENEQVVQGFAAAQGDCILLPVAASGTLFLPPCMEHDGFFYALLGKSA